MDEPVINNQMPPAPRRSVLDNVIGLTILAAFVWCLYFSVNFRGLWAPDAMEYADVARNIAEGKGIVTNSIWGSVIYKHPGLPFPSLRRPPLYPILTAALFKLLGPSDFGAILISAAAYVATVIPLYLLVSRAFGRSAAMLAAILYIFHNQSLHYSISGLTESLSAFLLTVFLCVFFGQEGGLNSFLAGVIAGLAQMTNDQAIPCVMLALAVSVVGPRSEKRWRQAGLVLLGFLLVVMPFVLYNRIEFGVWPYNKADPMVALIPAPSPEAANLRSLHPVSAWTFVTTQPWTLVKKFLVYFDGLIRASLFGALVSPIIVTGFLLGLFSSRPTNDAARPYVFVLILVFGQMLILSLLYYVDARYLMSFAPSIIGFGVGWLVKQAQHISARPAIRNGVLGVVIAIALQPYQILESFRGRGEFTRDYESGGQSAYVVNLLENHTSREAVVVTDLPWAAAWYARRAAILYPASMAELAELNDRILRVDAVLITSQITTAFRARFTQAMDAPWRRLLEKTPPHLELKDGSRICIFALRQKVDWPERAVLYVRKNS